MVGAHFLGRILPKLIGARLTQHDTLRRTLLPLVSLSGVKFKFLTQSGEKEPISVMVDTFGTGDAEALTKLVNAHFDLTPAGIIERLKLRQPIYQNTAAYGHFGREEPGFTWEETDYVEKLR